MTYILLVSGDDYAATHFEEQYSEERRARLVKLMIQEGYDKYDIEETITASLQHFDKIDPAFIDFIRSEIQDYDDSKHKEFYTFTEEELADVEPLTED